MELTQKEKMAAKAFARMGGLKGGKARAEAMTPEERSESARQAAEARWAKEKKGKDHDEILTATHGSQDRPLRIGSLEIPCYVLEDGRRVLIQSSMIGALGLSYGGSYSAGGDRLAKFAAQNRLKAFVSMDLLDRTAEPLRFRTPKGGIAYGYEATVLADICEAVLAARNAGVLQKQQTHLASQCEILWGYH